MTRPTHDDALYRPCVGLAIRNPHGEVFVGRRRDERVEAWQMPQGGIDPGETPYEAALRELGEETGLAPHHVSYVTELPDWLYYDLPAELQGTLWGGKFVGQKQKWFVVNFQGNDSDIDIMTLEPEFIAWKWVNVSSLSSLIVPFKRAIYQTLVDFLARVP